MTHREIYAKLAEIAPAVAFGDSREPDDSFVWDGDGPDPAKNGMRAYDVDVYARAIVGGQLIEGAASLGGSYFEDEEETADIHGYLPQMLEEAAGELISLLDGRECRELKMSLNECRMFLGDEMMARYDAQRAEARQ